MAVTNVFNSTIAPHTSVTPAAVAITPTTGVEVSLKVTMSGTDGGVIPVLDVSYQYSIDGGTTYGQSIPLLTEIEFSSTGIEINEPLPGIDKAADHIQFTLYNRDPKSTATVVLGVDAY